MPSCQLCKKSFKTRYKMDGKIHNLCNRKYCLDCSPFGKHNTVKLADKFNQKIHGVYFGSNKTHRVCSKCNKIKERGEFYINKERIQSVCKNCHNAYLMNKWKKRKIIMVEEFGGKCEICGYSKNFASLTFHHKEPAMKEISWTKLRLRSIDKIRKELKKCQLLCRNCHGEIHHPDLVLNNYI